MTINQAFKALLDNWPDQDQEFKNKYRSYKSKHEKAKKMKAKEVKEKLYYVGEGKMREILEAAGYTIEIKVKPPKKMKWIYKKEPDEWHKGEYVIKKIDGAVFKFLLFKNGKYASQHQELEQAKREAS